MITFRMKSRVQTKRKMPAGLMQEKKRTLARAKKLVQILRRKLAMRQLTKVLKERVKKRENAFQSRPFAQSAYEVNVNATTIGGLNVTGAVYAWSENPLRVGSVDGAAIGKSTGKCTLLPGEQMWMCSGIFKISNQDTITTMGLSPNNQERGSLAVTGGTGCYQNANGTIYITSQGETSESFLLEYQASNADEACSIQDLVGEGLSEANVGGKTIGDYETVGSKDLWAGNILTDSSGAQIGLSYGDCTLLPGVAAFMCIGEWALDSGDIVTYAGYSPNSMNPGHIAVTGGTGCYAGASGTLLLKAANEEYSSYDWNYQPKPEAETCFSLVDTLGGHLIYESSSGSIVIGDYETPGSMDIWFNNSMYTGSHDGALLEGMYSLGECTLLANATEFMCTEQFVLNATDGSSIVAAGFSPNSFEDGTMAISGTGCFTGIKGGLTITAQSIEEDYDYFSYEVKSTNEKEDASGVDAGEETDSSKGEEAGSNTEEEISNETVDKSTEGESEKEGECIPIETLCPVCI
mmetsp:Transcript_25367/g.51619  ORF Transcript_25367/g.51619 Transcript_25367/m.51619 type:complete len:521 (-) Transcript_25367:661-2223(-)